MLEFIQYKDLLLTQYEYDRGQLVDPKVMKQRQKMLADGKVKIIVDSENRGEKKKIDRKK